MPIDRPSLCWHAFHVVKRGHPSEEYEDAFAGDPATGRFAVADGASETSYAALWARLLVEGFVSTGLNVSAVDGWLTGLRHQWAAEVDQKPLPWYAEIKRELGAAATFLGLQIRPRRPNDKGMWRAFALGDTCLLRVRKDRLLRPLPLSGSKEFNNRPPLIGSRQGPMAASIRAVKGTWLRGDTFFLMTDALAEWFLDRHEKGEKPWRHLGKWTADDSRPYDFASRIEEMRDHGGLRNDDVTLLSVQP
jgi:hypothetical protein